ncbi:hypothetical protein BJY04DRAFT_185532 [Aspergillus karnatakaensis]|uniref:uncharacterized protein n=1 Tax=Aspergillus karnatakaensis TaxID=1810916 RepID=UPI003CCDD772
MSKFWIIFFILLGLLAAVAGASAIYSIVKPPKRDLVNQYFDEQRRYMRGVRERNFEMLRLQVGRDGWGGRGMHMNTRGREEDSVC